MVNLTELSFVGPLHNHIMQELTQLGNFPNYSDQEVYDTGKTVVETYYQQNNLGDPQVLPFSDYQDQVNSVLNQGEDMANFFTSLKNEGKINQEQLDFLLNINSHYLNADNPNSLADNLFQIEQDVAASTTLDFNQKALVYGTAVIGRNSGNYWYAAYNNPNNPWYDTPAAAEKPKWWVRGLRDLAGFTAGFLVGSLLSGGNPIVGAAAGTVTGGGSSAA